jgi:hypothetical protein
MRLTALLYISFFALKTDAQECGVSEVWQQFAYLNGQWKVENSNMIEVWETREEDVMLGKSYSINGRDSILNEVIQLYFDGQNILYSARVKEQNQGNAVLFKLSSCKNNTFLFTNREHDYPQTIGYRKISNDKMLVWIEGNYNGKPKKSEWAMKKHLQRGN